MIKAILKSKRLGFFKKLALVFVLSMFGIIQTSLAALPQNIEVKGKVTEESTGNVLIGVSVVIKGTTVGTITDIDGNFTINVATGDILVFSYIGYTNQEITFSGQSELNVTMSTDNVGLDEVVVVGYGVQKKKLNTGATLNMKGDDLQKLNTSDAMSSLQGISPGVSITNESGKPGAGTKVNIRGVGTIGNSQPLYVVDGIQVSNIDYLSPSDIESIDVLKDAASAAIYGSQAANGVILVTTKRGKKGQDAIVSYDNYFGFQNIAKDPGMLGAIQYMAAQDEAEMNSNGAPIDWASQGIPDLENIQNGTNPGTDWFNSIIKKNALVQNHAINLLGSSEKSTYAFGASYLHNEGLIGVQAKPDYKRMTLRLNSEHVIKKWNDLDGIVFGENVTYTNTENPSVADGDIYWNDVRSHLTMSPLTPMFNEDGEYHYAIDWDERANPTAVMDYERKNTENNSNNIVGNVYLEVQPIRNLKIRSSYGISNYWGAGRSWVPMYDLARLSQRDKDMVRQNSYMGYSWIWTNTAAYNYIYNEQHNFNVVIGQEAQRSERALSFTGVKRQSIFQDWEYGYLDNFGEQDISWIQLNGRDDYGWAMSSLFGRLSYDYKERYLLTAVIRRDGSSNFGPNNRYATFPSVSAGWIASQESFMSSIPALSYLKLRGSWGQNGNQDITPFQDVAQISYENAFYSFGPDKNNNTLGSKLAQLPNPNAKWETSVQTNIGIDAHFLNSRLQTSFDWYNKTTKDWLVVAPALATNGAPSPYINGGTIENKGIELMLKWSDQISDFKYSITGTMAHNKNEITDIANEEGIIHGVPFVLSHGISEIYRAQVGYPIGYFWGYKSLPVFTSDQQALDYVNELRSNADAWAAANGLEPKYDAQMTENKLTAGEMGFIDQNGDGLINDEDKVQIGDPNPDYIFGIQLSLEYKDAYLQVVGVGKTGHQVAMAYRSYTNTPKNNYTQDYYDRAWHAERNPGGDLPQLQSTATNSTKYESDIHIYNANYFRFSNITLGYNFKNLLGSEIFKDLRLYVTAQNLLTITKYPGMDPEVGYGPTSETIPANNQPWATGIDLGLYPSSKTFMFGLSVKF